MHWGYRIALVYTAFVFFMLFLVYRAFQESFDLVTPNYYQEELRHQEKIDQKALAQALGADKPSLRIDAQGLQIIFKPELLEAVEGGEIYLFRPSDARLDKRMALKPALETGQQRIALADLEQGVYEVQLAWQMNKQAYFLQERIYVP